MGQLKKVIVIILAVILSITVLATTLYAAYSTGTYRITAKSGLNVRAGAGAHLRVNSNKHSMLVIQVDNDGFYYTDANATSKANIICLGYITWSDFKKQWNNVYYTEKYKG